MHVRCGIARNNIRELVDMDSIAIVGNPEDGKSREDISPVIVRHKGSVNVALMTRLACDEMTRTCGARCSSDGGVGTTGEATDLTTESWSQ